MFRKFLMATFLLSPAVFADSICTSYWPWGACALWTQTSTLSGGGGGGGNYHEVSYRNDCRYTIFTGNRMRGTDNKWGTTGWFKIQPGQTVFIGNTNNSIIYTYAESENPDPQKRLIWSGTDTYDAIRAQGRYGFKESRIPSDAWHRFTHTFTCPNQ